MPSVPVNLICTTHRHAVSRRLLLREHCHCMPEQREALVTISPTYEQCKTNAILSTCTEKKAHLQLALQAFLLMLYRYQRKYCMSSAQRRHAVRHAKAPHTGLAPARGSGSCQCSCRWRQPVPQKRAQPSQGLSSEVIALHGVHRAQHAPPAARR